jgi:hypothetical protein
MIFQCWKIQRIEGFYMSYLDTSQSKVFDAEIKALNKVWFPRLKKDRVKWLPAFKEHCKEYDAKVKRARAKDKKRSCEW